MADTPRVTVPVEPEYTATDYLRLIAEGWEVIESAGSQMTIQNPEDDGPQDLVIDVDAMLSAVPAPEGGAVRQAVIGFDVEEYIEGYEFRGDEGGYTPTDDERALITDAIYGVLSELSIATREEGPAEAGESLHPHAQPFEQYPELALHIERMAMSGVVGSMISWDAFLRELNAALRAQPPAREDAQPVAKVVRLGFSKGGISFTSAGNEADLPDGTPLFTHPAPDALRVAVEAIGKAVVVRAFCASDPLSYRLEFANEDDRLAAANAIDQALAALQAEQKGGA